MRFKPYGRYAYEWTQRKEAAAVRRLRREREAYPLFAEQIGEQQPSIDDIRERRLAQSAKTECAMRARQAASWRAVRARFFAIPASDRAELLRYWNAHRWFPGEPTHLNYLIGKYEKGGLAALDA